MKLRNNLLHLVVLLVIASLFLVACERPLPGGYNDPEAGVDTTAPEVPGDVPGVDSEAYPAEGAEAQAPAEEAPADAEAYPAEETEVAEAYPAEEGAEEQTLIEEGEAAATEGEEGAAEGEEAAPEAEEAAGEEVAETPGTHTVAEGENLYRIGLLYGISWVDLAEANGITDPASLSVGQVLTIPSAEETAEEAVDAEAAEEMEPAEEAEAAEESEAAEEAEADASVTGDVTYLQRIALPDDAVVEVSIYNASLADASEIVGVQVIETAGAQVPIPFDVAYSSGDINENLLYSVSARIEDGAGNLLFISDTAVPVITNGNPTTDVEIVTIQVEAAVDAAAPAEGEAEAAEESEAEAVEEAAEGTVVYIVQQGDNLFRIGINYGVDWTEIAAANGIVGNAIYPGMELIIPVAGGDGADAEADTDAGAETVEDETGADAAGEEITYVVQEGDSIYSVAFEHGVPWTAVVEANDIEAPYTLEVGQTLIIYAPAITE